ncbi:uncharacterized protein LOC144609037 [Rhinoraja longicauda]
MIFSTWLAYLMFRFREPQTHGPDDRTEDETTACPDDGKVVSGEDIEQHDTTPAAAIRALESGDTTAAGDEAQMPEEVAGPSKAVAEGQPEKGSLSFGVHYTIAQLREKREVEERSAEAMLQPRKQHDSVEQLAGTETVTEASTTGESSIERPPPSRPIEENISTLEHPKRKPTIFHRPTTQQTSVLKGTVKQSIRMQCIGIGFSTWRPGEITSTQKRQRSWGMEKLNIQKTFSIAANMGWCGSGATGGPTED